MLTPDEQREVVQSFLADFEKIRAEAGVVVFGIKVSSLLYACLRVAEELEFNKGDVFCQGFLVNVDPEWSGIQYIYEVKTSKTE